MALAQRAGLADLVSSTLTLKAIGAMNAHLKVPALVAGMLTTPPQQGPIKEPVEEPDRPAASSRPYTQDRNRIA